MTNTKTLTIDKTLAALDRQFGKGIIKNLTEHKWNKESLSTQSLGSDDALGGGLVKGKIHELFGQEASGKTTFAIHCAAEAQKNGTVVWMDMEHAFDKEYATDLGLDIDKLLFSQPDTQEDCHEVVEALAATDGISMIVIDSVAALCPRAELEGDSGAAMMGLSARIMGQHVRKLTPVASRNNTIVFYINQLRANLAAFGFQSKVITPGGNALKYFASVRMSIAKIGTIKGKEGEPPIGIKSRLTVLKSRTGPSLRTAEFDIKYGKGIDKVGEVVDAGVVAGIVEKSGAWFSYGSDRLGQGRENSIKFLEDNPQLTELIKKDILEKRKTDG
jgi:recombination protein RecA